MLLNFNLQERTLFILAAIGTGLCSVTLLLSIWQWYHDWRLVSMDVAPETALMSSKATQVILALPQAHLFGQAFEKGYVPITNLQLHVTGIVKAMNEREVSKAYISVADQPSKIYQEGDLVLDNVKISAILPDAIMLDNSGHLEKLPLPRQSLEFKPLPSKSEEE